MQSTKGDFIIITSSSAPSLRQTQPKKKKKKKKKRREALGASLSRAIATRRMSFLRRNRPLLAVTLLAGAVALFVSFSLRPDTVSTRDLVSRTNELLLRVMRQDGEGPSVSPEAWEDDELGREEKWMAALRAVLGDTLAELGVPAFPKDERERVREMINPCWRFEGQEAESSMHCLPAFYVLGHWLTGGADLGMRLKRHEAVAIAQQPHFWNTHSKHLEEYFPMWDVCDGRPPSTSCASKIAGDCSPGYFATSFSESLRFHRAYEDVSYECWKSCMDKESDAYDVEPLVPTSKEEDDKRRLSASASPRRRCIDGVDGDEEASPGCIARARAVDPTEENGGDFLSLPHLIRAAYGTASPKFILILREPGARLHDAFWYEGWGHYRGHYGADEDGFEAFAKEMMQHFRDCVALTSSARSCANRFESYGPRFQLVFFHADQLIKNLYSVFLETWMEVFPRESFLVLRSEDIWLGSESSRKIEIAKVLGTCAPQIMPRRRRTLDPAGLSLINKHAHRIGVSDADTEHSQLCF